MSASTRSGPIGTVMERREDVDVDRLHTEYWCTRDESLRRVIVDHYQPLARSLAVRAARDSQDEEDVAQVALMGLLKAVDRYDPARGTRFSTFAWATIRGEIKRYRRDSRWSVHVPRALQETYLRVATVIDEQTQEMGRSPTVPEIAERSGRTEEEVLEAIEVGSALRPTSLDAPASNDDEPHQLDGGDAGHARADERHLARSLLSRLPPRERHIVELRFFEDLTQHEIAARIGLSQMHVSRLLARSLELLRATSPGPDMAAAG